MLIGQDALPAGTGQLGATMDHNNGLQILADDVERLNHVRSEARDREAANLRLLLFWRFQPCRAAVPAGRPSGHQGRLLRFATSRAGSGWNSECLFSCQSRCRHQFCL